MHKIALKYSDLPSSNPNGTKPECTPIFIEARIKAPLTKGSKVGFGLLPEPQTQKAGAPYCRPEDECGAYGAWPASGQITSMEHVGTEVKVSYGVQLEKFDRHTYLTTSTLLGDTVGDWHVYIVEWHCEYVRWFIDGQEVHQVGPGNTGPLLQGPKEELTQVWPFDQPFYMVMGVSVGGKLVGSEVEEKPSVMFVDYVKVYTADPVAENSTAVPNGILQGNSTGAAPAAAGSALPLSAILLGPRVDQP